MKRLCQPCRAPAVSGGEALRGSSEVTAAKNASSAWGGEITKRRLWCKLAPQPKLQAGWGGMWASTFLYFVPLCRNSLACFWPMPGWSGAAALGSCCLLGWLEGRRRGVACTGRVSPSPARGGSVVPRRASLAPVPFCRRAGVDPCRGVGQGAGVPSSCLIAVPFDAV